MWTKDHWRSDANHTGSIWFRVRQRIALSWGSWGCRKVTLMPHPLKWPPQALLGAFPFAVWKNWRGGIHESTAQRKEHSKTEFGRKNSEKKFGESETFYRSKFSRATGVRRVFHPWIRQVECSSTLPSARTSASWHFYKFQGLGLLHLMDSNEGKGCVYSKHVYSQGALTCIYHPTQSLPSRVTPHIPPQVSCLDRGCTFSSKHSHVLLRISRWRELVSDSFRFVVSSLLLWGISSACFQIWSSSVSQVCPM